METLAEHAALKSCVLGGELSHCSVSVVETGVADAGRDSAEPVTVSCHGVNVNTSGVATLVTAQVKDGVEPTGVLQPEVLGQHGNVSLLTVDSEAIALSGDPQVIHQLHIQHGLEDRAPENGEGTCLLFRVPTGTAQGKWPKKNPVRENTGNLEIWPKHREFGLINL